MSERKEYLIGKPILAPTPVPAPEEPSRHRKGAPILAPTPTEPTPVTPTPTPAPTLTPSYRSKTEYSQPSIPSQPAYEPSPFRPQPAITPYLGEAYQKWRSEREFPFEKLEEMRKKRLAKEEPVKLAIPPTIKFGAYEVKTEYVAIGTLALIIIALVIFL